MCLKRLDIQGFKSFADRIKLELNPGLTVVVGPNGSGKSNISDAISWCLGEQRASSLRGSRMEDVIFAGSDKRKPVGMAEVTLTLDNANKLFPLPYEEISVSRRLYRSGESEYLINKVPCRLKDIQALFMDTGLGRGAYSLIGQGKVDEILSSRPEERRSVIEEAAGIVKYRHRKEEAERKLTAAQQDLNRISDIIHELADRIEPLSLQAEKARQFNRLQKELHHIELSLFKRDWEDLNAKLREINEQLTEIQAESDTEKPVVEENLAAARAKLQAIENILAEVKENTLALDTTIDKVKNKLSLVNEQINHADLDARRLEQVLAENLQLEQEIAVELAAEREKLAQIKRAQAKQRATDNLKLEQLTQEIHFRQEQLDNLNADLIDQLNVIANHRSTKNQATDRLEHFNQRLNHLRRMTAEAATRERELGLVLETAREKLADLKQRKLELTGQKSQIESELKQKQHEVTEVQSKLASTKELMVAKHSRLKVLEENLNSHSGFMRPVRELLKIASAGGGGLTGICGAVADLIRVPVGLETAIEAALGGALQNLVTETSAQAKEAIHYLKKSNLGRATFLPLDSLRPSPPGEWEKRALKLPGVIGLAANLVEVADKYRPVVELLLGRLVVVDSLENAITVARHMQQRLRLVTLTGELFHPGGSLSGGGPVRNAGSMLHTRRERDELAKEVRELHLQVKEYSEKLAASQNIQQELASKLHALQEAVVALDLEIQAADMEVQKTAEDINRSKNRDQENQWELTNVLQEIKNWSEVADKAGHELAAAEEQLNKLQDTINITQKELAVARENKAALEQTMHQENVRQAELRQAQLGLEKIIGRLEQELASKRVSQETSKQALLQLAERKQELSTQQNQLVQELQRLEQVKALAVAELADKQQQRDAAAETVKQLQAQLEELQEQWLQTSQRLHNLELQQTRVQTELDVLMTRLEENGIDNPDQLDIVPAVNKKQARHTMAHLKQQIEALGPVNAGAEAEYAEVTERYNFLLNQKKDLEESIRSLEQLISELNRLMGSQFQIAFTAINKNFNEVFQQLFGGGGATMTLTDEDALTCGIEITARPPGKKNQPLSLLSGGERALTAIALLFAILQYKPSPFCVLDEIEASLDEANVKRFADYLVRASDEVQFIVISHRKGTMERAQSLYGVTMDETGVTRVLSMSLGDKGNKEAKKLA